jgi:hypothetical protein
MSLNYAGVSSQIDAVYDTQKNTKQSDNAKQVPYVSAPATEWMDNYIVIYDADSVAGTFTLPAVVMVSNPSLLTFENDTKTCGGSNGMGQKIADYWSSQLTFGAPQNCSAIVGVTNDAAKIGPAIESFLCSQTSTAKTPNYEFIFSFIEDQVKSIIWTISESDSSPCSSTYTVTIS